MSELDVDGELLGSTAIVEDKNHGISEMEIQLLKEKLEKETGRFGDRHCDLTVIGDKAQITQFTEKLNSCFLTDKEIELWNNGHQFDDPWPSNVVRMVN